MSARFDASANRFVDGADDYDVAERDGWDGQDGETLFYLTDGQSNGRWLYVDRPDADGDIEVGILRVYRKNISPKAARAMAAALIQAADESDAQKPARMARERERRRQQGLMVNTAAAGGVVSITWPGRQ